MAFGELYRLEFTDYLGRLGTLKLFQDGITDPYTEVIGSGDPVIISTNSDSDYLFNQIHGSECAINLISEINYQFIGLFSANAFKTKVEYWLEPEPDETQLLFWTGWLLPDQYSEPLDYDKNYGVLIVARDGLGALKDIEFLQDSGNKYVGKKQVVKIIADVLKKLKLDININIGVNLIEENAPEGITGDPLENIYLDYDAFYQDKAMDCEEVLKQILQTFGARIIQADGEWWIERIPMYLAAQTIYKYDKDGKFISSSIVQNQINYTGKYDTTVNQLYFVEKKGNLAISPAYKKFVINQDYGKLPSIILNSDFSDNVIVTGYRPSSPPVLVSYPESFDNWTIFPAGSQSPRNPFKYSSEFGLTLRYLTDFDALQRIESSQVYVTITKQKGFLIEYSTDQYRGTVRVEIKFNGKWIDENGGFQTSPYIITTTQSTNYEIRAIPADTESGYIKVIIYAFDVDGSEEYGYGYGYGRIKSMNIQFVDTDGTVYPEDAIFEAVIDENNNEVPEDINSILGDLPELTDNEDLYIGGYWYFDGLNYIPTKSWTVFGSGREMVLMTILGEAINDQYRNPKHKVSAALKGNFKLNKAIYIPMLQNRLYLPIRTDYSAKFCRTDTEMIEIVKETENEGGIVWGTDGLDYVVSGTDILTKV